jgi:hypothetical protein
MNVFLGLASLFLIYKITKGFGQRQANIAVTLFVFWPDQLTLTSVLASEHFATVLMLAGTFFFYSWQKERRTYDLILAAIFFTLAFEARSVLGVLITVAIIISLWKREWYAALLLLLCFICTHRLYETILASQGINSQPSSIIFSLLIGTNLESSGAWNDRDAMLYGAFLPDCEEANQWALLTAITRLQSGITTVANLALKKVMSFIFFGGGYGMYYNRLVFPTSLFTSSFLLSMAYQLLTPLVAIVVILFRRHSLPNINFLLLVLFMLSLAHMILEVANRYSYITMPLWFIIIGAGLRNPVGRQMKSP